MSKTLIVNIFGGPSIDKSTIATGVFCLLKMNGIECELITEFAKDLVWEKRYKALENQQYVFAKQYHKIWRLLNSVDVIITDSPLMLSVVYAHLFTPESYIESFINNVVDVTNSLDNLNIVLERVNDYNTHGRYQTEMEEKELDVDIKQKLSQYNMGWDEIDADFAGVNGVVNIIAKKLGNVDVGFRIAKIR